MPKDTLEIAVDQAFEHLQALGRPVSDKRRHGLNQENLSNYLDLEGLHDTKDIMKLYTVADGTQTHAGEVMEDIWFFPGYFWMSMEEASSVYKEMCCCDQWNPAWFPIFASDGGDYYAVACTSRLDSSHNVVRFLRGEINHDVMFSNIESMFLTLNKCFSQGVFYCDEGNKFKSDVRKMRQISREIQIGFKEYEVSA